MFAIMSCKNEVIKNNAKFEMFPKLKTITIWDNKLC